jgi:outer membrane protein OmpA-like peptidoglycan-associated protein
MKDKHLAFEGDEAVTLHRTDHDDAKYHVIVNDQPSDLPVITADGAPVAGSGLLHFAVVDDAAFPLIMVWEWAGQSDSSKMVKITYPQAKIEKELKEQGRAEIYGIYFDFDSDQLRSESEPVLTEIAEVLKKQPDWKLSVRGHTDNVGGDTHNLDLSQRRAASVIKALFTRYQIAAERLSPTGFGASKPKAGNDTVEGRAKPPRRAGPQIGDQIGPRCLRSRTARAKKAAAISRLIHNWGCVRNSPGNGLVSESMDMPPAGWAALF